MKRSEEIHQHIMMRRQLWCDTITAYIHGASSLPGQDFMQLHLEAAYVADETLRKFDRMFKETE